MSTENNFTFDENKYQIKSRVILGQSKVPGMTKFLIQKGIVKTEKTAHTLMLVGCYANAISASADEDAQSVRFFNY